VQQSVVIPAGSNPVLRYFLWVGAVNAPFDATMTVRIDGTVIQTITEPSAAESGYTERTVAIPPQFADGAAHVIRFEYNNPAGSGTSNFFLDDVSLEAGCLAPSCDTIVSYTGPPVSIPDNNPAGVNISLPVSGVGTVTDLNFRFDTGGTCDATAGNVNAAVDHTFVGDLIFRLTPPDGSPTVTFMNRRGGTRENICLTMLDDEGGFPNISTLTSVTGTPVSGNFSPETTGMLSLFDGENANGTWTLNVSDNASADTGSVRRFSLIFGMACATPTPTPTPVSGRVLDANGRGLGNAKVLMTDAQGVRRLVITNQLGFYSITQVIVGQQYAVSVTSKRFRFLSRELLVTANVSDFDFVGLE
jgi:subtilisin-like proprotein convertase family protein